MTTQTRPSPSVLRVVIPNALSFGRIVLGLAFPFLSPGWRLATFLIAAFTDLIDGEISRRLGGTSTLGRVIDPIADKVVVFMVVGTLLWEGTLPVWQAALVGLRDLMVLAGTVWVLVSRQWRGYTQMSPTLLAKVATGAQFVFLLVLLAWPEYSFPVFVAAACLSGLAALDYARIFFVHGPREPMEIGRARAEPSDIPPSSRR